LAFGTVGVEAVTQQRVTIIPYLHDKLTRDGKQSEPDIDRIIEQWLGRHPAIKRRRQDIRVVRGTMTLPQGVITDLVHVTLVAGDDIEGYDPAQDQDLYAYFVADDQDG
jgi:hypothetical protein